MEQVREEGGDDTEALLQLATSPSRGAPSSSGRSDFHPGDVAKAQTEPSPLDAVVTPITAADEPRLLFLLALLASMTVAVRRERR